MSKVLYIIGIVLSVVFLFVCGYYVSEVDAAQRADFMNYLSSSLDSYGYGGYSSSLSSLNDGVAEDLTVEGGLISLLFFAFFIFADVTGIVKVKTTTMKVFGIIGLSISGLFLLLDFLMIASPGSMSFDEIGGGFVFYCFIMLAFSIVGLVQSINFAKQGQAPVPIAGNPVGNSTRDLLDS